MLIAVGLGAPAEARVAVLCTLIATGVAVAVQAVLLALRLRRILPPGPRRYAWRRWFGACLPIAASDLASAGFNFIDVVVLSLLAPPATVGLYSPRPASSNSWSSCTSPPPPPRPALHRRPCGRDAAGSPPWCGCRPA